jgi:hypothetical protein
MTERRIHERIEASHSVLYVRQGYPAPKVASTLDLSLGGARIETPYSLTKGEKLEISIAIRPQVITFRGQVVHIEWPDGERLEAGVRFEEFSKMDSLYLDYHISTIMERQNREHGIIQG